MFEKEAENYVMGTKAKEAIQKQIPYFEFAQMMYVTGAEFGYNKSKEEFKICEQNADAYYDKLQKAKRIIQEFLELNYSEFTKTNAVFLHAHKFLKESK